MVLWFLAITGWLFALVVVFYSHYKLIKWRITYDEWFHDGDKVLEEATRKIKEAKRIKKLWEEAGEVMPGAEDYFD